jgi:photosystem II stability/assembly factor-like uncharacterized protein
VLLLVWLTAHFAASSQPSSVWQPAVSAALYAEAQSLDRVGPFFSGGVWVVSGGAKSWATKDGGKTWVSTRFPENVQIEALAVVSPRAAWAAGAIAGGPAWLGFTTDRGGTWISKQIAADSRPGVFSDVQFFDKARGVAVGGGDLNAGGRSLIAVTHDGGNSWNARLLDGEDSPSVLRRVRFESARVVWAVGRDAIYSSRDSGDSWQLVYREPAASDLSGLAVTKDRRIFATGGWGLLIQSSDSGRTWERVSLPPDAGDHYLGSVDFADGLRGWVGGDHGFIIGTNDGGHTWRREVTQTDGLIRDIAVIGRTVYAVADGIPVLTRTFWRGFASTLRQHGPAHDVGDQSQLRRKQQQCHPNHAHQRNIGIEVFRESRANTGDFLPRDDPAKLSRLRRKRRLHNSDGLAAGRAETRGIVETRAALSAEHIGPIIRGAGTRACRADTRVGACLRSFP